MSKQLEYFRLQVEMVDVCEVEYIHKAGSCPKRWVVYFDGMFKRWESYREGMTVYKAAKQDGRLIDENRS